MDGVELIAEIDELQHDGPDELQVLGPLRLGHPGAVEPMLELVEIDLQHLAAPAASNATGRHARGLGEGLGRTGPNIFLHVKLLSVCTPFLLHE
ncbi:MAG: hypothetical protein AAFP17_07905 [Pseudomonadota bacterium]